MSQEDELKNMQNLACILHSVYFGTFQALKGENEFFDVYEIAIKGVNSMVNSYFKQMKYKDLEKTISDLEETGLYQGLDLKQKGDKYIFTVRKCLFAAGEGGVHSSIKGLDIPCPIALAIGASLLRQNPTKKIYVYPSVYDPEGTVTQMDLMTPLEYKKKISVLKKIARSKR
jgi:hypothetical protein